MKDQLTEEDLNIDSREVRVSLRFMIPGDFYYEAKRRSEDSGRSVQKEAEDLLIFVLDKLEDLEDLFYTKRRKEERTLSLEEVNALLKDEGDE